MRYRILRGGPARRFVFARGAAVPPDHNAAPAAPPPRAKDVENPYYRCYGQARRKEELVQK